MPANFFSSTDRPQAVATQAAEVRAARRVV